MLGKRYLLLADALKLILNSAAKGHLSTERLKIEECYGCITASDIISLEDFPAFCRSTVDGYALNSADTFGAKETLPVYIALNHEVVMGAPPDFEIKRGEAAKIPTGGMLPEGADAVLMLEHAEMVSDDMVEVLMPVASNENMIQRGKDIKKGEVALKKGHRLRPQDIGVLAGIGILEIDVFKKPVVSIISTGDEIVSASSHLNGQRAYFPKQALESPACPADAGRSEQIQNKLFLTSDSLQLAAEKINAGKMRDINSFILSGMIDSSGGIPVKKGIFRDDYEIIKKAIKEALDDSDAVLITGGTSVGTKDMTAQIINDVGRLYEGMGVFFHGVSLKPGKSMIGGVVNNKPILGLPGHPAATIVCFDLFVRPIIERLSGLNSKNYYVSSVKAKMAACVASAIGRVDHIRVYLEERDNELFAVPILSKSGLITTLVKADGIVVIPPEKLGIDVGEDVSVRLF